MARVNHAAVIVAAIAYYLFGWLWYTIFAKTWVALSGLTPAQQSPGPTPFIVSAIVSILVAYVVAIALSDSTNPNPARHGVEFGIFFGVGLIMLTALTTYMYEARPLGLWAIDTGYHALGLAIMGGIIGAWRKRTAAAAA